MNSILLCPVCAGMMTSGYQPWHHRCLSCGYESSILVASINDGNCPSQLDEIERASGLRALREKNYRIIISIIRSMTGLSKPRLLDIGAAHGWFLDMTASMFDCHGIEPDQNIFNITSARGVELRQGYFPDVLGNDEIYDILVFNDVFEHIPDPARIIDACYRHLSESGLLVLNLPVSDGILYRVSKILLLISVKGPFNRLWQYGLPSPHLHYFNKNNLKRLANAHGFAIEKRVILSSVTLKGLYERISCKKGSLRIVNMMYFVLVMMLYPLIIIMPGDINLFVFRKE